MGLNWNFFRITPDQHIRVLSDPTFETVEKIEEERFAEGLARIHSPGADGQAITSFDTVYHLILRTNYDELDTLMTFEDDEGPVVMWPLGEGGVELSSLNEVAYLLDPEEVRSLAPTLQLLLDVYLDQRYHTEIEQFAEESPEDGDIAELKELYPELRACFSDLTNFVQTAARNGEAILWELA